MTASFTTAQRISLALLPKLTGFLSILGSLWIIMDILLHSRREQSKQSPSQQQHSSPTVRQQLLLGLSCVDATTSLSVFLSTWPIPKAAQHHEDEIMWAVGNDTTCAIQGFMIQFGSAAFCYNAMLTVYYVLVIRFSVKEERLKRHNNISLFFFHAPPLLFGFLTALTSLIRGYYGNANLWCFLAGFDEAHIYRWAFYYGPLWFCFLVVLIGMYLVIAGVYKKERQTAELDSHRRYERAVSIATSTTSTCVQQQSESAPKHDEEGTGVAAQPPRPRRQSHRRRHSEALHSAKRTRQVAEQAVLYIMAFYLTYFFSTVNRIYQQIHSDSSLYVLLLLHVIFAPLQGTFNFLVYRRPYLLKLRKEHPDWSWPGVLYKSLSFDIDARQHQHQHHHHHHHHHHQEHQQERRSSGPRVLGASILTLSLRRHHHPGAEIAELDLESNSELKEPNEIKKSSSPVEQQ